jgi:hypothetical protein
MLVAMRSLLARLRQTRFVTRAVFALVALPLLVNAVAFGRDSATPWFEQRRDSAGLAPDPAATPEAVIQIYAVRAVGWRGVFSVHTWVAVKPSGAASFTRYEVIGFGVSRGLPAVVIDRTGPDNYWFGARPELVLDRRGPGVDALIERIRAAAESYPYPHSYWAWPGPNSNTFTAHIGRAVPELGLVMPSNAIGKDFLPDGDLVAATPSGTGYQASLFGLFGLTAARDEGIELTLLGLTIGIDVASPAIKLPGIGRIGLPRS